MPHLRGNWVLVIAIDLGLILVLFLPGLVRSQPPEPAGGPGLARFCPITPYGSRPYAICSRSPARQWLGDACQDESAASSIRPSTR